MNNYETVFIVTPVLSDQQVQEVADKFQGVITENGGQIVNKESWGLKKLAYPIQKKTTGFYFLVEFTGEGSIVNALETQYRRDEPRARLKSIVSALSLAVWAVAIFAFLSIDSKNS